MKNNTLAMLVVAFLAVLTGSQAHAEADWNSAEYDLYPGDFDGDGATDLLYVAKDPSKASGIARSDGNGPNIPWQSWLSNYLGIPWHSNLYRIVVADFNNDNRSDVFLQRTSAGDHYLLLANDNGKFTAINQTIANQYLGYTWSADEHRAHAGDFDGDGRADLFLQGTRRTSTHFIVTANGNGQFVSAPVQSWTDASWGAFKWSTQTSNIFVGDFNGDGRSDLLVQAKPNIVMIDFDPAFPVPTYTPNSFGVALSQGGTTPFQQVGVQQWSRNTHGVDWSPNSSDIVIGDFDGNGTDDVLMQARGAGRSSYRVSGNAAGAAFSTGVALATNVTWASSSYRLVAGNFDGSGGVGVYWQSTSSGGTNALANSITGGSVSQTTHNPAAPTGVVPASVAGHTVGSFAVSHSGAATYSIPIVAPPGVAGVQPNLSINYQSTAGNGLLGMGWSLGGFSEIGRCGKTREQDGANAGVALSTADRFCLDGNKLRLTGGTYGASGSTYGTEMETFSRITAQGTAGNGPSYFVVEAKNGLIFEYGSSADSRIEAVNSPATSTPHTWALNKVTDRHGNTMTLSYQKDGAPNGSYRPSEILYTANANAGLSAAYKVVLVHAPRATNDILTAYVGGGVMKETMRLDRIETQYNEPDFGWRLVRKYQLSYNTSGSTPRTRLGAIQECDRNGACLSPTTITWQDGDKGWVGTDTTSSSDPSALMQYSYPIDIDGDGRDDLVYPQVVSGTAWWHYMRGDGSGGFGAPVNTGINAGDSTNLQYAQAQTIDYFSEGRMGLLVNAPGYSTRQILRWNGSTLTLTNTDLTVAMTGKEWVGDFDGDGRADLLYTTHASGIGNFYVQKHAGATSGTAQFLAAQLFLSVSANSDLSPFNAWTAGSRGRLVDFNGDGRADFIYSDTDTICTFTPCVHNTTWRLLLSTGTSFTETRSTSCILQGSVKCHGVPSVGDFNGDGLTDVIMQSREFGAPSPTWILMYGSGIGLTAGTVLSLPSDFNATGFSEDYDRDGRVDLVYAPSSTSGSWYVLRSTGTGFEAPVAIALASSSANNTVRVLDVDGDGLRDLGFQSSNFRVRKHKGKVPDLLAAITDGFGNAVDITYASLTDASVYTRGTGAAFPEMDVQGAMQVVKSYSTSDGIGGRYSVTQKYAGLRAHLQGRGLLGFASRESIDSRTGIKSTWTFRQDHPYIGFVSLSATYQYASGPMIAQVSNTPKQLPVQGGAFEQRYFPYVWESTQTNYEVSADPGFNGAAIASVKTTTEMDSNGNPTDVTTDSTDLTGSAQTFKSVSSNTYANAACAWRGFATTQKVTNTVPGYAAQSRTIDYSVDSTNPTACRVYQEIIEPTQPLTSALRLTTTFGYDAFGHPNSRTISGQDIEPRVTTISFGAQGVFPESVTTSVSSSFSQTESNTYDFAFGVPKTATDPNGLVTTFGYDGFGRLIKETRPDGTKSEAIYSACSVANGYCGDARLRYLVTTNELDATTPGAILDTSVQRFDGLGRALYEEARTVSGASMVVATSYDNQGRVSQRSQPYFSGSPAYFTTFSYDLLGRPTQEQRQISEGNSGTQTVKYAYQRLTETFEDGNGKVTTKKHNAIGQVVQVTDAASGVTSHEFDQFGNLRKTADPAGNQIVSTFNVRGFKETLSDPDLGNWSYTYYPTGELRTQTDAKSQVVTLTYDRLARPKTRVEPEGTTTFTYGVSAAAKNIGKMQSVSAPGGYSESFVYDSLGRLQDATTNADATSFVISKTYNATTGYLETLTYPASTTAVPNSRFKIKYEYQNGQMARVRDFNTPSTVYWESVATNAAGQVIDEQYGNGVRTYSTYDGVTGLLGERTAGTSAQVQNLTYQWDKVGNLTQRRDLALSHTEDFTYDDLNRLKTSKLNNVANLSLTYYANGNIQTKSDVGTYSYPLAGAVRPHAVTSAGSRSFGYDANGNMNARDGSTITWYSFNKPNRINQGSNYSQLYYDADHSRYKQVAVTAAGGSLPAGTETTIYISGLFEKVTKPSGVIEYKHYIMAGNDPIAIRTLRSNSSNDTRYLHRDHIGSVTAITDESGAVLQRLSYDAFGKRRNATSWGGALTTGDWTSIASITHRAFTFHEQLDNVDLINMNGRVYDPGIGRFISADPFVQAPLMSQSLNRYSYVMNNPLSLIDPSGYSWLSKAFKSIGNFIKTYWREIVAVIVVVVSMGTLAPIVGAAGGFWGAVAIGATAGAIYGASVTALYGGNLGDIVAGAVTGAIAGGIAAGATYGMGLLFSSPSQPTVAEKPVDFGVKSMQQQASDTVKRQISSTGINAETVAAITTAYHVLSTKERTKMNAEITNSASELLLHINGLDDRQFVEQFTMSGSADRRYLQSNSIAAFAARRSMVNDLTALLTKGMMGVGKQGTQWAIESGRDASISRGISKLIGLKGKALDAFNSAKKAMKTGDKFAKKMEPGKLVFGGIQCGVSDPVTGCTALFSVTE